MRKKKNDEREKKRKKMSTSRHPTDMTDPDRHQRLP